MRKWTATAFVLCTTTGPVCAWWGHIFQTEVSDSRFSRFSHCIPVSGWGVIPCYHALSGTRFRLRQVYVRTVVSDVYCSLGKWTATLFTTVCLRRKTVLSCPSARKAISPCTFPDFPLSLVCIYVCESSHWHLVSSTSPTTLLEMWSLLNPEKPGLTNPTY